MGSEGEDADGTSHHSRRMQGQEKHHKGVDSRNGRSSSGGGVSGVNDVTGVSGSVRSSVNAAVVLLAAVAWLLVLFIQRVETIYAL